MNDTLPMPKGVAAVACDTPCACGERCAAVSVGVYGLFREENNPAPVKVVPIVSGAIENVSNAWIEARDGKVSFMVRGVCGNQAKSCDFRINCRRLEPHGN